MTSFLIFGISGNTFTDAKYSVVGASSWFDCSSSFREDIVLVLAC